MLGEGHMVFEFSQLLSPHPFLSTYNCYSWQSSVMFWNFTERVVSTEVGIFWYISFPFQYSFFLFKWGFGVKGNPQSWSEFAYISLDLKLFNCKITKWSKHCGYIARLINFELSTTYLVARMLSPRAIKRIYGNFQNVTEQSIHPCAGSCMNFKLSSTPSNS